MHSATCLRCTRIFLGPFGDAERLPRHLDALLGIPCPGAGDVPAMSPTMSFEEPLLEAPVWASR